MTEFTPLLRVRCDPPAAEFLEWTQGRVHLSRACTCERAGLRGVPLARVDLLIDSRIDSRCDPATRTDPDPSSSTVLEFGEKAGRHSGARRDRWTWRSVEHTATAYQGIPWAQLEIEAAGRSTRVLLRGGDGAVLLERVYPRLNWVFSRPDDAGRLVWWHARRHFGFLLAAEAEDDVAALAATFTIPLSVATVSEANRLAERALYRLARDLGWRKMTLRERVRCWGAAAGQDRPQWHRADEVAALLLQTGCGEATHRAAAGGTLAPWGGAEDLP